MAFDKNRRGKRRKVSYLTLNKITNVDYKDVTILKRFLTERGKILPRRVTGNTASQQRMITASVQKARSMALLPYVGNIESEREPRDGHRRHGGFGGHHGGGHREGGFTPRPQAAEGGAPSAPPAPQA